MKSIKLIMILMLIAVSIFALSEERVSRLREAEHLIIAPDEFIVLANQLTDFYYDEFGIQRTVVDQQDIFDQYSGGIPDAEAIKTYIMDFFDDPSAWLECSVLLMGSGTNDWNNSSPKNKIMVFGNSDDNFVDFDNDLQPEIPIGRLPAKNVTDLQLMIDRMIQYINEPNIGWWRNKVLITADDEYKAGGLEGLTYNSGLNHTARAQDVSEILNDGVWVDKVLGIEYDFDEFGHKPEAAQDLIDRINEGRLIWYYIGHGNKDLLGDEYYFHVSQHLQLLQNSQHLSLFIAASPNVGHFDDPDFDCMAEILLYYSNGGSIASIAPTRSCSGNPNTTLIKRFLENIINNDDYLGAGLLEAKLNSGANLANSKLFNLLGDPLLFVNPPQSDTSIIIEGNPDTLFVGQEVEVVGQVEPSSDFEYAKIKSFESEYDLNYTNTLGNQTYSVDYTKFGIPFFENEVIISNGNYYDYFTIPETIQFGEHARIISYIYNEEQNTDYIQYCYPLIISDENVNVTEDIIDPVFVNMYNYPNPFNSSTTIHFKTTNSPEFSRIEIYNLKGQKVRTLNIENCKLNIGKTVWDGMDENNKPVNSGIYFYKLNIENSPVKKMILLK